MRRTHNNEVIFTLPVRVGQGKSARGAIIPNPAASRSTHVSSIETTDLPRYVRAWQYDGSSLKRGPTAADLLGGVSRWTIYKLIREGSLKAVKLHNRMTLIEVASISSYLDSIGFSGREG